MQYIVVDFKGFVSWIKLDNGSYAVDPAYLKSFLELFNKE